MSSWAGPGPEPLLTRSAGSPSDDRRSAYGGGNGGSNRGGYYNSYGGDRSDGYGREWDEWERGVGLVKKVFEVEEVQKPENIED